MGSELTPILKFEEINDEELIVFTEDKSDRINANPAFAAVDPSTATVDAKKAQYNTALVKCTGGCDKATTALKNQFRAELERLLFLQAHDCAVIANGNLPLYLSTGYSVKSPPTPTGQLPQVTGFYLDYGDNDGELKAAWNPVKKAQNFTVQVYTNADDPDGSVIKEYIRSKIGKTKTIIGGLPSGKKVRARVRANGGSTGNGAWSDPAEKRVP